MLPVFKIMTVTWAIKASVLKAEAFIPWIQYHRVMGVTANIIILNYLSNDNMVFGHNWV